MSSKKQSKLYNKRVDRIFGTLIVACTAVYVTASGLWPTVVGLVLTFWGVLVGLLGAGMVFAVVVSLVASFHKWIWNGKRIFASLDDDFGLLGSVLMLGIGLFFLFLCYHLEPGFVSMMKTNLWR